jgi:hypothetical protein
MSKIVGHEPVASRIRRVDGAIEAMSRARAQGVNEAESRSLADVERQGLVFVGYLQDLAERRMGMNAFESQVVFAEVDRWCTAVEEGMAATADGARQ